MKKKNLIKNNFTYSYSILVDFIIVIIISRLFFICIALFLVFLNEHIRKFSLLIKVHEAESSASANFRLPDLTFEIPFCLIMLSA